MKTKINASEMIEQVQKSQSETPEEVKAQLECEIMEEMEEMEEKGQNTNDMEDINKIVKGVYSYCLATVARETREKYKTEQYVVETIQGSKTRYYIEATNEQDQPVKLTKEAQSEIIEACTTLYWRDVNTIRRMPNMTLDPDQKRLQDLWNKYNLWTLFIFISNRPKPKQKKPQELCRIGSSLASAILNAWTTTTNEAGMVIAGAPLPIETKRILLKLAQYVPKNLQVEQQPNLFGEWAPSAITISSKGLKNISEDLFGHSRPEGLHRVITNLQAAAATSITLTRKVERSEKRGAPRRGALQFYTGPFITIHGEIPYAIMPDGAKVFEVPDSINISLNNVFGYWIKRYYSIADIPAILKRSRGKGGMEYLALRLWAIDIAPQVAAATKGKNFEATFAIANLTGEALTTNPDGSPIERTKASKYARKEMRKRLKGVVNEAAKDMGATYLGLAYERKQGGQKIIGLRFRWIQKSKEDGCINLKNDPPLFEK